MLEKGCNSVEYEEASGSSFEIHTRKTEAEFASFGCNCGRMDDGFEREVFQLYNSTVPADVQDGCGENTVWHFGEVFEDRMVFTAAAQAIQLGIFFLCTKADGVQATGLVQRFSGPNVVEDLALVEQVRIAVGRCCEWTERNYAKAVVESGLGTEGRWRCLAVKFVAADNGVGNLYELIVRWCEVSGFIDGR